MKITPKIFAVLILSFAASLAAQEIKTQRLNVSQKFYHPHFSPNDNFILLTSEDYQGIWIYYTDNGKLIEISDSPSSGYRFKITDDSENIVFRKDKFISGRRYSSVYIYNIKTGTEKLLESGIRSLSSFDVIDNTIGYLSGNDLKFYDLQSGRNLTNVKNTDGFVFEQNAEIFEGKEKLYVKSEVQETFQIWTKISSDRNMIVYTSNGPNTIIADRDGKIISEIKNANYGSLSFSNDMVCFMRDEDDGRRVTASRIFAAEIDGKNKIQISADNEIAMYPAWANHSNKIIYNTIDGRIFIAEIEGE